LIRVSHNPDRRPARRRRRQEADGPYPPGPMALSDSACSRCDKGTQSG
jgi:hypothetical protein